MSDSIFLTDGNGTITGLTEYGMTLSEIVIPAQIGDEAITTIGSGAFLGVVSFNSVIISEGIQTIGTNAFAYGGITSIRIPASVMNIMGSAFMSDGRLSCVIFDGYPMNISAYAFESDVESVLTVYCAEDASYIRSGLYRTRTPIFKDLSLADTDFLVEGEMICSIASAIRNKINSTEDVEPENFVRAIADMKLMQNWAGELTINVDSSLTNASYCSLSVDSFSGMAFLVLRGSTNTNYENIYYVAGQMSLPDGVTFLETQLYGGPTGGSGGRYFVAAFAGVRGKINVTVSLSANPNTTYDYWTPMITMTYVE